MRYYAGVSVACLAGIVPDKHEVWLGDLEQGVAEEAGAGRLEDNIRVSICDVLNRIIRPLCDKLSRVSWIINSHADLSSQLQAMIFECNIPRHLQQSTKAICKHKESC